MKWDWTEQKIEVRKKRIKISKVNEKTKTKISPLKSFNNLRLFN